MKCFFDLPPAVRRDLVDFKDGVARQFWLGRVEDEFFMKGVSRCHCLLWFVYNMRTHRLAQNLPFFFPERTLKDPNCTRYETRILKTQNRLPDLLSKVGIVSTVVQKSKTIGGQKRDSFADLTAKLTTKLF
jgi:hypothetical protein